MKERVAPLARYASAGLLATTIAAGVATPSSVASSSPTFPTSNLVEATSAAAFVRALLRDAPVPSGGRVVPGTAGLVDASGIPLLGHLRDVHEVIAFAHPIDLASFLRARRPEGATLSPPGSMTGSNIPNETSYEYVLPFASRHVSYERLDYSLATSTSGGATLRVDAQAVWVPVVTVVMPTRHVVLTGYDHLSLSMGPSGAVARTLTAAQARRLGRVISRLSTSGGAGWCAEESPLFVLTTKTATNPSRAWTATAEECPDVLEVVIGTRHVTLDDSSCALRDLVVSDLPRVGVSATRDALRESCPA